MKQPIHPAVIERHAKVKPWNEYICDYFGLNMVKREMADYRYIGIFQGKHKLLEVHDFQLRPLTNAEMHKKVKAFLDVYTESVRKFNDFTLDSGFRPPGL